VARASKDVNEAAERSAKPLLAMRITSRVESGTSLPTVAARLVHQQETMFLSRNFRRKNEEEPKGLLVD
jgi:hypothetical protein